MPSVDYKEGLYERLQNPELAAMYIEEALNDGDPEVIKICLQDIIDARALDLEVREKDAA